MPADGLSVGVIASVLSRERVAVGVGPCHALRSDGAGGTRLVVDDEPLSEDVAHLLADETGDEIRRPPGAKPTTIWMGRLG